MKRSYGSGPSRSRASGPKASSSFPVTVAWVTLGRPSSPRLATFDGLGTKSIVNGWVSPGHGQRRGLARLRDEALEVGPRDRPHVQAREDGVRVGDEAQAEAVARGCVVAIDEAPGHERSEQSRHRALVDRGALRELAHTRPGRQLGEGVEQREGAVDGRERAAFLSHRTRHVATTTCL